MVLNLRLWLMARRGDQSGEERELKSLVAIDPGNTTALERLAIRMVSLGRVKDAEELRRRKGELDQAHERYQSMLQGDDVTSRASELAELAVELGRRFDSQAWSILAEAQLSNCGPAGAGWPSANSSPLGGALAAKALGLSSPFALRVGPRAVAGPTLNDQLVSLRDPKSEMKPGLVSGTGIASQGTIEFVDDGEPRGPPLRFRQWEDPEAPAPRDHVGRRGPDRFRR